MLILFATIIYACMVAASDADDERMGDLQYAPDGEWGQHDNIRNERIGRSADMDDIDETGRPNKQVMGNRTYIAAPVVGLSEEQKEQRNQVADRALDMFQGTVYTPWTLKIPNAWNMPMNEWARCVFTQDLIGLDCSDTVVVCDYGRKSTAGTAWEAGYAFAKGKNVLVVQMPGVDEASLMVRNGCTAVVSYEEFVEHPFSWPDYKKCTGITQN